MLPRLLAACLHVLCAVLLVILPSADPMVTMPVTHITRELNAARAVLPQTDITLITNDDSRLVRAEKIRRLFARHELPLTRIHDADLRRLVDPARVATVTETTWGFTDQHNHSMCLISINRDDYNNAGSNYWRDSWGVTDPSLALAVDPVAIGNWDVNHELYHCMAYALDFPSPATPATDAARQLYEEAGADAYAGLVHLKEGGGRELLHLIGLIRRTRVTDDQEHYTQEVLDAIYADLGHYNQAALVNLPPTQLALLARHTVDANWTQMAKVLTEIKGSGDLARSLHASGSCRLRRLARHWSSTFVAHIPRGGWGLRLLGGPV